jgi:uncharacterized protein involved in outer membrane biogenesis
MKLRRAVLGAGVLAAIVVAATVVYLLTSLDAIVERAIERYGSEVTGSAVRVTSVDISLSSGRGTVRGVAIANPKGRGFSSGSAFRLEEITLQIDVASLGSTPVVLEEVRIGAPVVRFELNQEGTANIDVIRKHATRGEAARPEEEEKPLRLLIRRFSMGRGEVDVDTTAVGGKQMEARLPPLSLRDIGGSGGATPGEVGKIVVVALTRQVAAAVAAQRLGSYIDKKIDEKLQGEAGQAVKDLLHSLTE